MKRFITILSLLLALSPAFAQSGKQKNYVTKEEYQFTAADLAKFADFERKIFDKLPCDDTLLHFALSTDDELLGDHHYLEEKFPKCQDFNYFDQQGHRFAGVKILKPIIERTISTKS